MSARLIIGYAGFLMAAGCVFSAQAAPAGPERLLGRQPAAVQRTIRAELGDGKLRSIDRDDEDGDVTYDVEMVRGGKTRSFTVGPEGELLDVEVFLEELPATVQQTIKKKVGGATLGEINKPAGAEETNYDVEMIGGGKTRTFTVDATGKLTDEEVFLPELPGDFQKTIQKESGSGTLDAITRSFDGGEIFYDVDVITKGKTQTLMFDSKGALLSRQEEVVLSAVPDAAQKQIQNLSAGGKLVSIAKVTENEAVAFDVDIRQDGKVKSYSLDGGGKVLSPDAN